MAGLRPSASLCSCGDALAKKLPGLEAGVAAAVALTQLLMEVSRIEPDGESRAEFRNTEGDYFSFKKKLTEWPQRLGLESGADFTLRGTPGTWVHSPAPGKQNSAAR
jgi:hypothetical protein